MAEVILSQFSSVINRHLRAHDELTLNISKALSTLHLITDSVEATQSYCKVDLYLLWSLLDMLNTAKNQSDRMFEELSSIGKEQKNQNKASAASTSDAPAPCARAYSAPQKSGSNYHTKQARNVSKANPKSSNKVDCS